MAPQVLTRGPGTCLWCRPSKRPLQSTKDNLLFTALRRRLLGAVLELKGEGRDRGTARQVHCCSVMGPCELLGRQCDVQLSRIPVDSKPIQETAKKESSLPPKVSVMNRSRYAHTDPGHTQLYHDQELITTATLTLGREDTRIHWAIKHCTGASHSQFTQPGPQ